MDETRARQIWESTTDFRLVDAITLEEARQADAWIKGYALEKLEQYLIRETPKHVREYVLSMAQFHFGSAETDELLKSLGCYPSWMKRSE
jgi:hypothetical protein